MNQEPAVVCEKDEFTLDITINRIVTTALENLYKSQILSHEVRRYAFSVLETYPYTSKINLNREISQPSRLNRHTYYYKTVIHLARLLFELRLLSHKEGEWSLFDTDIEAKDLHRLLERFLYKFYEKEQNSYKVSFETLQWSLNGGYASIRLLRGNREQNKRNKLIFR